MAKYSDISEHFYRNGLLDTNIIRVFRFAFPILRVNAKIRTRMANMEYHIVEKYIDKLIAGKSSESLKGTKTGPSDVSYMSNKNEVFALLGIDREVYDLANYFYYDLLKNGHFTETPQGLVSTGEGIASLKMNKKTVSSNIDAHILVTPIDAKICPGETEKYRPRSASQLCRENDNRIVFCPVPEYCYNAELLQDMINEANFYLGDSDTESYAEINLLKKLPAGTVGIEISDDTEKPFCEVLYLCYFLVVREEDEKRTYHLLTMNSNEPVSDFDLNSESYGYFRRYMSSLVDSDRDELYCRLGNLDLLTIKKNNCPADPGVELLPDGNYSVGLTDEMLIRLLTSKADGDVFPLEMIVDGAPFIIDDYEAGKLVYVRATDGQKDILRQVIAEPEKKEAIAEKTLQRASDEGSATAQTELCRYYLLRDKNEEAFNQVLKAAEQNDPLGQFLLAGCYYLGKGTEKDYEKALRYMSASAEQDFGYAFHDLAIFCYMGHGTKKDEAAAAGHMKKAAEKGLPLAQYSLGWFYHKGIGVDKDPLAAIRWYEKASKHGHLVADYQLAMMYMKGDETEKSCERAMRYFKKVAAKRHDEALECYDVKDDFAKKYCFSKESRKKNVSLCRTLMRESMFRVGSLYESGDPAQRDAEKARVWYKLAYDNGYSPAKEKLDLLNNE